MNTQEPTTSIRQSQPAGGRNPCGYGGGSTSFLGHRPALFRFVHEAERATPATRLRVLFRAAGNLGRLAAKVSISFNEALDCIEAMAEACGLAADSPVILRLQQVAGRAFGVAAEPANRALIRAEADRLRAALVRATDPDFEAVRKTGERICQGLVINRVAEAFADVIAIDASRDEPDRVTSHLLPRTISASLMRVFSALWVTPENKELRVECLHGARRMIDKREQRRAALEAAAEVRGMPEPPANDVVLTDEGEILPAVLPEPPAEVVAVEPPVVVSFPSKPESQSVETPDQKLARQLDHLTRPPGLVGDIVDWMEASSRRPSRILALAAALAFVGTLAGRMYESPTELRTNTYLVSLAPTGFGKEHARKTMKKLAAKAHLTRFIGAERIMSASALRKAIEQQPSLLYALDEFGGFMKELNDSRAGSHVKQIRDLILSLVGAAESFYSGADYADSRGVVVQNPNLSLLGLTTPADFWDSMTGSGISDGFLPRLVIIPALGHRPANREPPVKSDPPEALVEACRQLASVKPLGGPLAGATNDGTTAIKPRMVRWAGQSKSHYAKMEASCEQHGDDRGVVESDLWSRVPANAQTLAMIVAIGRDPHDPEIWPQDLEWAFELVSLCARHTIEQVDGRLAENDRQREYLFVKRAIGEAGASGIGKTALNKRVNGRFDSKRLGAILQQLEDAGDISTATSQNPNGGPIQHRYVRRDAMPLAA